MARKLQSEPIFSCPQIVHWGALHHPCFSCKEDFQVYRLALETARQKYACRIHAYLMTGNNVRLLATADQDWSLHDLMESVSRRYNRYRKRVYGKSGLIAAATCNITTVDVKQCLLTLCIDMELCPVREGFVDRPDRYLWSSYGHNALGRFDPVVSYHEIYLGLGETKEQRQATYRRLFQRIQTEDHRDKGFAACTA